MLDLPMTLCGSGPQTPRAFCTQAAPSTTPACRTRPLAAFVPCLLRRCSVPRTSASRRRLFRLWTPQCCSLPSPRSLDPVDSPTTPPPTRSSMRSLPLTHIPGCPPRVCSGERGQTLGWRRVTREPFESSRASGSAACRPSTALRLLEPSWGRAGYRPCARLTGPS